MPAIDPPAPPSEQTHCVPFVVRALALMLGLHALYYYPYEAGSFAHALIDAFLRMQAAGSAALIRLFDGEVSLQGTIISGRFPLEIVRSCSSLDAQALFAATVLAFPARIPMKVLGLAAGSVALSALNMVRIASLYFIGADMPDIFDEARDELLPLALVVMACMCFGAWVRWALAQEQAVARAEVSY